MSNLPALRLIEWIRAALDENAELPVWSADRDQDTEGLVLRNRLGPLLDAVAQRSKGVPESCRVAFADQTQRIFLAHESRVRSFGDWIPALPSEGWCMMRGPALGVSLYEDPVLRPYTDLDLLVMPDAVSEFVACLDRAGFSRVTGSYPDGYYLRHHFHLQRMRIDGRRSTMVELHWGLDHKWNARQPDPRRILEHPEVIRLGGVPIPVPDSTIWWQVLAQHLLKHIPALPQWVAHGEAGRLVEEGELIRLLDLALLLPRVSLDRILDEAESWGGRVHCLAVLHAIAQLMPERMERTLPDCPLVGAVRDVAAPHVGNVQRSAVFRYGRLPEVAQGIFPAKSDLQIRYGDARFGKRVQHAVRYGGSAGFAAIETLWRLLNSRDKKHWP